MIYHINRCKKGDTDYPKALAELKGMPELLYYKGDISILNKSRNIAIIGSRECSDKALSFSHEAGRVAAECGLNVVNGFAIGCDTAAILGAVENGGKCVAIMPGGLNTIYPKSNSELADKVLDNGGCIISEYEPDTIPKKYTFVERDRLQSAISQGILVVEAQMSSGTMHTVNAAIKQNRCIAAYADAILKASGNDYVINHRGTTVYDEETLKGYFLRLPEIETYEQLSLF